jgi:chromosome condensin MukBEF complex kleisin-like MukF subunit
MLCDYSHYHAWVVNYSDQLSLYRFEDITLNTEAFISSFIERLEWEAVSDLSEKIGKADEVFLAREKEKDPMGSSLPQDVRQNLKLHYAEVIQACDEYSLAQRLYNRLLEKAIKC